MKRLSIGLTALLLLIVAQPAPTADQTAQRTPKEALQAFQDLIGSWRATGTPEGTREQKQKGFWTETLSWEWQFKGQDVWLQIAFDKGKYFASGELRYLPAKNLYQFTVVTTGKETLTFEGAWQDRRLTLDRTDEKKKESQRLVFNLLHSNRILYWYEQKPQEQNFFAKLYQVGATKEGVPFANAGSTAPECVVSGGLGTTAVMYMGKTYYVCCSGCRVAFQDEPVKYIKEYEARKAKEAKEKGK